MTASEPVAVQVLPLFLPITSIALSGIAIVVFCVLLWIGHRRKETGPVRNQLLIGIIVGGLALELGAPLNQLNLLPTPIWTWVSVAARLVVMVCLVTLLSIDADVQAWLDRVDARIRGKR